MMLVHDRALVVGVLDPSALGAGVPTKTRLDSTGN